MGSAVVKVRVRKTMPELRLTEGAVGEVVGTVTTANSTGYLVQIGIRKVRLFDYEVEEIKE
jgi:hypothetical protein